MLLETIEWEPREAMMFGLFLRAPKFSAAVFIATLMVLGLSTQSRAQTTGTVHLKIAKVGFIVGVGGGSGTLTYHGRTYRLSVGGVSLGTIGVSAVNLAGTAHHLHRAADIAGAYNAASASVAVVGGGKVATLINEKGVVIELRGVQLGLEASLSLSGMSLTLQ
jgi:hypothetical protein